MNSNINLGYLAKHLTWDKNIKISLSDCKDTESDILKDKIKNISKKYYKYKGKYLRLKKDTSSLEYFTRSNNNTNNNSENSNNIKTIKKSINIEL